VRLQRRHDPGSYLKRGGLSDDERADPASTLLAALAAVAGAVYVDRTEAAARRGGVRATPRIG
jgi:hypothetical protein